MLNGIDIYDGQYGIDIPATGADFVIVKATQGDWEQDHWHEQVNNVLGAGKLLGLYHFPEVDKGATAEADYFSSCVKEYVGRAALFLDWEDNGVTGQKNLAAGVSYAKEWLDRVYANTGVRPLIYTNKSTTGEYDFTEIANAGYRLWGAQYLYKYYNNPTHGFVEDPELRSDWGAFGSPLIYQYNSTGTIDGWSGNIDKDVFYGTAEDWQALCAVESITNAASDNTENKGSESTMATIDCANVAATIHADMVNDDRNGYSWSPRTGGDHPDGNKTLTIDGRKYTYALGSWDCSSSVCKAWQLAIQYTSYAGALDGATYTGNMRSVFENSGLFYSSTDWAKRGDVYLNDSQHTTMCQDGGSDGVYGYDCMSSFCINEFGEVYGGEVGDQTGKEACIQAFYDFNIGPTLHYNGKADSTAKSSGSSGSSYSVSGSIDELAQKVINGEFGNGDERKAALGDKYDAVQKRVNQILNGDTSSDDSGSVDIDALAKAVINGDYGNGDERKKALGDNYEAVQKRVNQILNGEDSSYSDRINKLAQKVINGDYGNGQERKDALGDDYAAVQARVNEILS